MTVERFNFQRCCCANIPGPILEIGPNNHPAGLNTEFADRYISADRYSHDGALDYPIPADYYFDAGNDIWPFGENSLSLVVIGDVTEHLYPREAQHAYREAARVANHLCVTVPQDPRFMYEDNSAAGGSQHVSYCTERYMRRLLSETGWQITELHKVDYGPWAEGGFFILAHRMDTAPIPSGWS
jgi:hypothetical protein